MGRNTDRDWELIGEVEPYWGVITHDEYRARNLNADALEKLYGTGGQYVDLLLATIRARLDPSFTSKRALDFGCGVGRVTIPLAKVCEAVVGVDVSAGMLARARERCESLGIVNARFAKVDDTVSGAGEAFDLIHSFIVMQHIPPERGMRILRRLIGLLAEGGVGVLHFAYAEQRRQHPGPTASLAARVRHQTGEFARALAGPLVLRLRPGHDTSGPAPVRSYCYELSAVLTVVQESGVRRMHVECTDHAGLYGVILFFQRTPGAEYIA